VSLKPRLGPWRRCAVRALGLLCLLRADLARAESADTRAESALSWDYPTFRPVEYVATGVLGAAWFAVFFGAKGRSTPRWTGGILFDDAVRDSVRLRSPGARDAVRGLSDIMATSTAALAVGLDALAVPLFRGRSDIAWQLVLMDAEAIAASGLLTTSAYYYTGRARPSYDDCQRNPSFDPLCNAGATSSFWSGHTAGAFAAAGLSCAHHAYLHLYGDPTADALGCAGMITLASTTGVLRLVGDRHFASDVLVGAAVGFGFGYGLPVLLHYTAGRDESLIVTPSSQGFGLAVSGQF
jgi:membrane-associated phospholipid phosphatase